MTRLIARCACREIDITKHEDLHREAEDVGLFCGRCKTVMVTSRVAKNTPSAFVGKTVELLQTLHTADGNNKPKDMPPGTYKVKWAGQDRIILVRVGGSLVPIAISGDKVELGECPCNTPGNGVSWTKREDGSMCCVACNRVVFRKPGSREKHANIPVYVLDEAIKAGRAAVKP